MNKQEIESAIMTVKMLQRLAFNVHGVMDVVDCKNIELIISALQQQLNNGWIPVSERLPDETGRYIVTYREWTDGNFLPKYDDTYVRIWRYRKDEQYTGFVYPRCCDAEAEKDTHREVLAWKIIEPYKEVSE